MDDPLQNRVLADNKQTSQQKQADRELHKSEEKFRLTFHTSPDSINLNSFDDGIYLDINEGFTKIMGYSREDVIGKSSISLNIWRDIKDRERLLSSLRNYGFIENLEADFIRKDGQIKTGLMSARLLSIDGKETIVSITRDITEKKLLEKKLIDSENRYRQLVENIAEVVWETDLDDVYTYISSGCLDVYGLDPEEVIGKKPFDFMSPEESERVGEVFRKIKGSRRSFYNLENTIQHADGREIYIETTGFPFFDSSGNLLGYQGTDVDITDRKQNDLDIQTLVESMVRAVGDDVFNTVTTKLCKWLDCECAIVGEIAGNNTVKALSMVLDGHVVSNYSYQLKGGPCEVTIRDGYSYYPENVCSLFPDDNDLVEMGSSGYVGVTLKDTNGNTTGILCCLSRGKLHISRNTKNVMKIIAARLSSSIERKRAEKERWLLESKLKQAQKMEAIGTLAGGIAHDFNNILFPVIGYAEMLLDEIPQDSPFRSSVDEIYSSAMRAKSLVNQILTFARQDNSEVTLMKMQHIVKEALKLVRSTVPTTIDIRHDISNECGLIKAEPTKIHQIVMNLATNAYHAMEERGGVMKISLKEVELDQIEALTQDVQPGIYACLTVSDNGVGMDKDLLEKIFNPFFTTKEQGKGTGIGLSVVHGIVKSAGGSIRVYSEPDKGTEFNVYLPVVESYLAQEDIQAKKDIQTGSERILLVDDEVSLIKMVKGMLERLGYKITSYTSSIEALAVFRASPDKFDLVITDMAMPQIAGDKLATELTRIRPDIPILLCTGFSSVISEKRALSMGIKGFLMKPVIMRDLARKIRDVLDSN